MSSLALTRLQQERKNWRKDRPLGFSAKPVAEENGQLNLLHWSCTIPGPTGTPYEGGLFRLDMFFPPEYPGKAASMQVYPSAISPERFPLWDRLFIDTERVKGMEAVDICEGNTAGNLRAAEGAQPC
ncbi:E2 SUMO-conjugating protein ubc9 [Cyanidiococcus yangmingshanensis]|uniref:E2 SUMO-conjugating protein ubc9 n=1 Tax=Cyanidiococcus yangmingshanensis TaxID=2690220 RepID=A0A7J7IIT7_9RHOD|nr:E2 SUMO-conjugating protein ubc9 [Cyanidiococcus yangmingshanensis]